MNYKRIINMLLSLALTLGLLSGCSGGTEPSTATPEELVIALDISEIQKEELLYMAELGFSMENIKQETISGREMAELLDKLVEYAALEKLDEWKEPTEAANLTWEKKSVIITHAMCLRHNNFKRKRTNVNCHWNDV